MPVIMLKHTERQIGPMAEAVTNLSLLQAKYIYRDANDPDARRYSLAMWVPDTFLERKINDLNKMFHDPKAPARKRDGYKSDIGRLLPIAKGMATKRKLESGNEADLDARRFVLRTGALSFCATLASRLIINQAEGALENAGLALDRHFSTPYIPGSAVKGIARVGASLMDKPNLREIQFVFGWAPGNGDRELPEELAERSFSGAVTFLPAYPEKGWSIELDILTPHHGDYYSDGGKKRALDNEGPNPQVFPVVKAGTTFEFLLRKRNSGLEEIREKLGIPANFDALQAAKQYLLNGLDQHGIGAKTAAGYGWLPDDEVRKENEDRAKAIRQQQEETARKDEEKARLQRAEEEAAALAAAKAAEKLAAMSPEERAAEEIAIMSDEDFGAFARTLAGKNEDEQKTFIRALKQNKERKHWWKMKVKKDKALADSIRKIATSLGESLL